MLVWSAHTHTSSCIPNNNKGVGKGSETGPMMGGLRVALRTPTVEPAPEPVQAPPGSPKVGSRMVGRAGGAGWRQLASPWRSWFSPRTRSCSVLWSRSSTTRWWRGFSSALWSRNSKRPASVSDVGLVALFSDVDKLLALSLLETWTLFLRAPRLADTCLRACDSPRKFLEEFPVFSCVKVSSDPEVDSRLHLEICMFTEPLVSDSHLPRSRQSTAFSHFLREGEFAS